MKKKKPIKLNIQFFEKNLKKIPLVRLIKGEMLIFKIHQKTVNKDSSEI